MSEVIDVHADPWSEKAMNSPYRAASNVPELEDPVEPWRDRVSALRAAMYRALSADNEVEARRSLVDGLETDDENGT